MIHLCHAGARAFWWFTMDLPASIPRIVRPVTVVTPLFIHRPEEAEVFREGQEQRLEKTDLELNLRGHSSSHVCYFLHGVLQQMHHIGMEEVWNPISGLRLHQGPYYDHEENQVLFPFPVADYTVYYQ